MKKPIWLFASIVIAFVGNILYAILMNGEQIRQGTVQIVNLPSEHKAVLLAIFAMFIFLVIMWHLANSKHEREWFNRIRRANAKKAYGDAARFDEKAWRGGGGYK